MSHTRVAVDAQLRVHGPVDEPDGARGQRGDVRHARDDSSGEARRRDVDRLLEVRPDERVGLVEHREHVEAVGTAQRAPRPRPPRPGTYSSTRSGPSAIARMRARRVARLRRRRRRGSRPGSPRVSIGFTTIGYPTAEALRGTSSAVFDDRERGLAAPPSPMSSSRIGALSRVAATACGSVW